MPLLLCAFTACLPWLLSAQPQRTALPFLPLASSQFCFRLARARFRCQYLSSLRFASGCLCSASSTPLYFWRLRTAPNRKFVSACDCHSFAARDQPISTVPSLASPQYHPFGTLQHFIVRDLVLPFDTHKVPEMPHVEGIQHFHFIFLR